MLNTLQYENYLYVALFGALAGVGLAWFVKNSNLCQHNSTIDENEERISQTSYLALLRIEIESSRKNSP